MKYYIFFNLLVLAINTNAQEVTRRIKNKETDSAVAYATVKVLHSTKGAIASENGEFSLNITLLDSVLVTCAGYETKLLRGQEVDSVISLAPRIKTLEEVVIYSGRAVQTIVLGNGAQSIKKEIKCKNYAPGSNATCWPWRLSTTHAEFAEKIHFPDSNAIYKINKIFVPVAKFSCWESLMLRIYEEDKITGMPGEELLVKPIHVSKANIFKSKILIDLSLENFVINKSHSFFISIGWLPDSNSNTCKTYTILFKTSNANTFSRTLTSYEFKWQKEWTFADPNSKEPYLRSTMYAVELDVMK